MPAEAKPYLLELNWAGAIENGQGKPCFPLNWSTCGCRFEKHEEMPLILYKVKNHFTNEFQ